MSLRQHLPQFRRLESHTLDSWRRIPTATASDCLNRDQTMAAAIKPLVRGMRLVGQAMTVRCMVGDNGPIHAAMRGAREGDVLVIDARGFTDTAVWGGLLTHAAMSRGLAGVVVDGAVRDTAVILAGGFPCFARAVSPAGPHKGFGGTIDGIVSCGGCSVAAGDLILGDDDGVTVVPLAEADSALEAAKSKVAQEEEALRRFAAGESLADQFGVPQARLLGTPPKDRPG